ncbi:MAG: hypothetical protein GY762_16365 [Proteobacteria bacterium]|nr:hypothetical protein [Pseudomonadota bacterium]
MNPRERFDAVVNHRVPDRVPIEWGRHVGSIHRNGYVALKAYLNDPDLKNENAILDRMVQNIYPDEKLLQKFNVDFRWIEPHWVGVKEAPGEDAYIDMWGIKWVKMLNSYSLYESPLADATIADLDSYDWPDPYNHEIWAGLGERAKWLYENTNYVIVADSIKGGLLTKALQVCGYMRYFSALAAELDFAEAVLDKLLWLYKEMWTGYMAEVGPYVQMVYFTDDIGAQNNMLISPSLFRSTIQPRLTELFDHIKSLGDVKLSYHTDGSVVPVMKEIIDMGVDILNPIQTSAMDMDTYWMAEEFGDRLVFHGAIDVQQMLPFSTPEEVRYDVAKRIWDLGRGGGYILSICHDIGEDVPSKNVIAMFEAAREYGNYPLQLEGILKPEDLNPTKTTPDLAQARAPKGKRPRRRPR